MEARKLGVAKKRKLYIYLGIPAFLLVGIAWVLWPPIFYLKMLLSMPVFLAFLFSLLPYILILIGVLMIFMLLRYSKHWNDQLVLSDEGFIDNAGFGFKNILIEWQDVKGYKMVKRMNKEFMFFDLKDEKKYLDKISRQATRNYLEKMKTHNGAYVGIAVDWYDMPKEELIAFFDDHISKEA